MKEPLVVFKEGVLLPLQIWETPHVSMMIRAAMLEAPPLVDNTLVITSVYRPATVKNVTTSLHPLCRAIDIRTGLYLDNGMYRRSDRVGALLESDPMKAFGIASDWAKSMAHRLGAEFDCVFGDANHLNHIHIERDFLKGAR